MELKFGMITTDAHAQLDKDIWLNNMSKAKWGDAIPQILPTQNVEHMRVDWGEADTERWFINGKVAELRGVCNCPTVMRDEKWGEAGAHRKYFPQRWSDVPLKVYDKAQRLQAMDEDTTDAEVMFFNSPFQSGTVFQHDAEFELECIKIYNDGVAEFRQYSDRYIPLTMLPYLGGIESTIAEVERAKKNGHRGLCMIQDPSRNHKDLPHFNSRYWDPLWKTCEDLGVPIHWHGGGGAGIGLDNWKGFTANETQGLGGNGNAAQSVIASIFSGVMDRYPKLWWIYAEIGMGWINYVIEGADHEWEKRKLWTQGLVTRPSEIFRRQMMVEFWFEKYGQVQRGDIGVDNIMWLNDYPHSTALYPESWDFVERTMAGVPTEDREKMLWRNAARIYDLDIVDVRV